MSYEYDCIPEKHFMNIHGLKNYLHLYFICISVTSVISVTVVVTVYLDYFYNSNIYHLK